MITLGDVRDLIDETNPNQAWHLSANVLDEYEQSWLDLTRNLRKKINNQVSQHDLGQNIFRIDEPLRLRLARIVHEDTVLESPALEALEELQELIASYS